MANVLNLIAAPHMGQRFVGLIAAVVMTVLMSSAAMARDNEAKNAAEATESQAPLHMLISLKEQKINVYRGLELVRSAPISSGRRGYNTPSGVFSILEKRRRHYSNLYDSAPMPYMQRLTWSGVALHQGYLPGYPASHGCIRLPRNFAKDLFGMTERGMQVVVTKEMVEPKLIRHPVLPKPVREETSVASLSSEMVAADPALRGTVNATELETDLPTTIPDRPNFDQPLRMIVTFRQPPNERKILQRLLNELGFDAGPVDGIIGRQTRAAIRQFEEDKELPVTGEVTPALLERVYKTANYVEEPHNAVLRIRRKFRDIYQAPVTLKDPDKKIGTHVFMALDFKPGDTTVDWMAVPAEGEQYGTAAGVLDRLVLPEKVRRDLGRMLTPGSSLIVTDRSFARNTGLGTDFVVVTR